MSDAETIHNLIRRGHRTSHGRTLTVVWRRVGDLEPGDVLAGLRAGAPTSRASEELRRATTSRTWADVVSVDTDHNVTRVDVTTRMGTPLSRAWIERAQLPVLELVSVSGQPLDGIEPNPDHGRTTTKEATS